MTGTVLSAAYLTAAIMGFLALGIPLLPDRLILIILPVVLVRRRGLAFVLDWLPFLIVLFAYEYLRGVVGLMVTRANYTAMIAFDNWLFGSVPTEALQARFFNPARLQWWDYAATLVYLCHFIASFALGLLLWLRRRDWFARFAAGFIGLSVLGLLTYLLFPAAPPWMAAQHGLLHVQQVLAFTFARVPTRVDLPTIYSLFDPDQVAAMPSLHAGYALLIALFTLRFFGRLALPVLLYPTAMGLSLVYLGEHYVVDVLAGFLFAAGAFAGAEAMFALRLRPGPRLLAVLPVVPPKKPGR